MPSWAANVDYDIVPADPPGYDADSQQMKCGLLIPHEGTTNARHRCSIIRWYATWHQRVGKIVHLYIWQWEAKSDWWMEQKSWHRMLLEMVSRSCGTSMSSCLIIGPWFSAVTHTPRHVIALGQRRVRKTCEVCRCRQEERIRSQSSNIRALEVTNLIDCTLNQVRSLTRLRQMNIKPFTGGKATKSTLWIPVKYLQSTSVQLVENMFHLALLEADRDI